MSWFWLTGLVAFSVLGPWHVYRALAARPPAHPPWRSDIGWYVLVIAAAVAIAFRDAVAGAELDPVERWAKGMISGCLALGFTIHTVRWHLAGRPLPLRAVGPTTPLPAAGEMSRAG